MAEPLHRKQSPAQGVHPIQRYVFPSAANRIAFTGEASGNPFNSVAPTAADIGAVARQTDTGEFYLLTNHSPITWTSIVGTEIRETRLAVRNETGSTIVKGRLCSPVGFNALENRVTVQLADKDDAAKRPAIGITEADIPTGSNFDLLVTGFLLDVDTSAFVITDQLVLGTAGVLSRPPLDAPFMTGEVQNIGSIARVHATAGIIAIALDGLEVVTAAQVFALQGTTGVPSDTNRYVTNSDPRLVTLVYGLVADVAQIDVGDAASAGVLTRVARADHQHAAPAALAGDLAAADAAAATAGVGTSIPRADHKHQVSTGAPTTTVKTDAAAAGAGVAAELVRRDAQWVLQTATPVAVGTANAQGTSASAARADHVHNTPFSAVNAALGAANASISVNSQLITNVLTPVSATDAVNKAYADALASGLKVRAPVRVIALTNITLSGPQVIDGESIVAGDRVLVAGQTTASQNGIYVAAAGAWTRALDMPAGSSGAGVFAFVQEGSSDNDDTGWVCNTDPPADIVGTDSLSFEKFSSVNLASVAPLDVTKAAAAVGTSGRAAREDHKHDISTAAPVAVGDANAEGAATSVARSNHVHRAAMPIALFGNSSVAATTTTRYLTPGYTDGLAPTAVIQYRVPSAGTLRKLRVRQNTGAGNGNAIVYTIRINGVASTVTVSMASTANDGSDLVNTVAVAAGDLVDIEVTKAASVGTSPSDIAATMELFV